MIYTRSHITKKNLVYGLFQFHLKVFYCKKIIKMDKKINKVAKFLACEFKGTLENIAIEETEALKINAKFFCLARLAY